MVAFCPHCRIEMGEESQFVDSKRHCAVCAALYSAVNEREFFRDAHQKWVAEQKNLNRQRPGNNYLE